MPETDSDMGAETARFQAFAARREDDLPPPWQMRAPGAKIGILIDSSQGYFSPKMKLLERDLAGKDRSIPR